MILSAVFASCALTGCVKNVSFQQNRSQPIGPPSLTGATPAAASDANAPASLRQQVGIIEFDDMGELWDRCSLDASNGHCQLREVLAWVEKERGEAEQEKAQPITLVFVHGWHHNANPEDESLMSFQEKVFSLQQAADQSFAKCAHPTAGERCDTTFAKRKVRFIGVYLGWRARTLKSPRQPLWADPDMFAFFGRETTAMRTALVSMSETFLRLRAASESPAGAGIYASRFLIIGHSFGGLIVERIIAQMLTEAVVGGEGGTTTCADGSKGYRPLADMVILLNSASDGILTEQAIDMMKRSHVKTCASAAVSIPNAPTPPLIVSLTSVGDKATGGWFAVGHGLAQIHMAFRGYAGCDFCGADPPDQGVLYRHTSGHLPFFHNYCYLDGTGRTGDPVCDQEQSFLGIQPRVRKTAAQGDVTAAAGAHTGTTQNPQAEALRVFPGGRSSPLTAAGEPVQGVRNLYRRCITAAGKAPDCGQNWNDTPYWILSVPLSLSKNHNDIWGTRMSTFLEDVVDATTPADPKLHTAIQ